VSAVFLVVAMLTATQPIQAKTLKLDYEGFTVWLDCERNGATLFHYAATADNGFYPRNQNFNLIRTLQNIASKHQPRHIKVQASARAMTVDI
jgi:hypothetical protein